VSDDSNELSRDARMLLDAARGGDDPSHADRVRIRRALMTAAIAGGAGLAASTAASSAAASSMASGSFATGTLATSSIATGTVATSTIATTTVATTTVATTTVAASSAVTLSVSAKIAAAVIVAGAVGTTVVVQQPWEPAPREEQTIAAHEARENGGGALEVSLREERARGRRGARAEDVVDEEIAPVEEIAPIEEEIAPVEEIEVAPVEPTAPAPQTIQAAIEERAALEQRNSRRTRASPAEREVAPQEAQAERAPARQPLTEQPPTEQPLTEQPQGGLGEELALFRAAHTALTSGDAEGALRLLSEHETRFPQGQFARDREATRVVALCRAGRPDAQATSARFLEAHPTHRMAARIRAACQ
jgi:hypothetical protein